MLLGKDDFRSPAYSFVVVVLGLTIIILTRLGIDQCQNYRKGMAEFEERNYQSAIMYFDRVLNAHIPYSPLEDKAKKKLLELANDSANEKELVLLCLETIRTTKYLTRHLFIPDEKSLNDLNDRIANLKAQILVQERPEKILSEEYDNQLEILNRDFAPSSFLSLIVVASFFMFIGMVLIGIWGRKSHYFLGAFLLFIVWIMGLYLS